MICDHIGCKIEPMRAPRVIVPSKTWLEPGHVSIRMMTTLHYCELHKGEVLIGDIMNAQQRQRFETFAKRHRPIGFKCDFDAAFIEYVLVTTPEYRQFLADIDIQKLVRFEA